MAVYHWSVYRPDLLPPSGLFAVGFAQDLVTGAALPASALALLLARAAVLRYRRHFVGRPFPFAWAGFAVLAAAVTVGLWALHCVLQLNLFDLRTAIIRGALDGRAVPGCQPGPGAQSARADRRVGMMRRALGPLPCLAMSSATRC